MLLVGVIGSPAVAAAANDPGPMVFDEVRVGDNATATRVVFDLRGQSAPYTWKVDDDGKGLTVLVQGDIAAPTLPKRSIGLVRTVAARVVDKGVLVSVSTGVPIKVLHNARLAPNATYQHYRIYFDLVRGAASSMPPGPIAIAPSAPAPMPSSPPVETATMAAPPPPEPIAPAEQPVAMVVPPPPPSVLSHGRPLVYTAADKSAPESAADNSESWATIKFGVAAERSFADRAVSAGPSVAVQTGILHDALEIEAGTAGLFDHGRADWNSGILLKKPFELSKSLEFEVGMGPQWIHKSPGEGPANSVGAEAIAEVVYWSTPHKSLGWYLESGYGYDFGKAHDSAIGLRLGVLVAVP